ncbi:hypothetical protein SO574_08095 [Vibrio alfacsensis]|uniref:hypothetical protein n=1 Tax=Vibrio alfacsensis TaxID=1074311 RepID=UPI002ADDF34E|nr:hypothetical protein [Vibrio alfacsensis]WQE75188.1 hypothetical protein SO574_08095 [Vibrio alfacsensis]
MKKSLLATSIALLLSACGGGSDSGSNEPVTPPKPTLPEETIQHIADAYNVSYDLVESVCNDAMFKCNGENTVDIYEINHLLSMTSEEDYFWNDTRFTIVNSNNLDLAEITPNSGKGKLTLHLGDSEEISYDLSDLYVGDDSADNKEIALILGSIVDVKESDNKEILQKLASFDGDISLSFQGSFLTNDGKEHPFGYFNANLGSEAHKAAFEILRLKNIELYTPEPANNAPVFESVIGSFSLKPFEHKTMQVEATDQDYDTVNYGISGPSFVSIDKQSGEITVTPNDTHVGDHKMTVFIWDEYEASNSQEIKFTVTELEAVEPTINDMSEMLVNFGEVQYFQFTGESNNETVLKFDIVVHAFNGSGVHSGAFHMSDNGNLRVDAQYLSAGDYNISVLASNGEAQVSKDFTVKVLEEVVQEPTIEDFANLIGEPVKKLEILFGEDSGYGWKITDKGEPVIYYQWYENSPYNFAFNLSTKVVSAGGNDHIGGPFTVLEGIKRVSISSNPEIEILDFTELELTQYGERALAAVSFTYTPEIIAELVHNSNSLYIWFNATNDLSGETVQINTSTSFVFSDTSYRDYVKEILLK